jgi:hypothetical protein
VGEGVGVCEGVAVVVNVGLRVRVGVAVTLASRWGRIWENEQAKTTQPAPMTAKTTRRFFILLLDKAKH